MRHLTEAPVIDVAPDERVAEAIELVASKRDSQGW